MVQVPTDNDLSRIPEEDDATTAIISIARPCLLPVEVVRCREDHPPLMGWKNSPHHTHRFFAQDCARLVLASKLDDGDGVARNECQSECEHAPGSHSLCHWSVRFWLHASTCLTYFTVENGEKGSLETCAR